MAILSLDSGIFSFCTGINQIRIYEVNPNSRPRLCLYILSYGELKEATSFLAKLNV